MKIRARRNIVLTLLLATMVFLGLFVSPQETFAAESGFKTSGVTSPTSLTVGQPFSVQGTVTSNNSMTKLEVGVMSKSTGKWQTCAHKTVAPKAKTYDLAKVDADMGFSKLPKGTYYYRIIASDYAATKTLVKKEFTVKEKSQTSSTTATDSKITITGATKPGALKLKQAFTVKGTVKSTYALKKVEVGVMNKSTGKWQSCAHKVVNTTAKTYDLNKVDADMGFKKLTKGTYRYKVIATDSKGTAKTLVNVVFTVGDVKAEETKPAASDSKITITGATKPGALKLKQAFEVKGVIKSTYALKKVEVGVVNKSTGKWQSCAHKVVNTTAKTYDINKVDADMGFKKLVKGTYYYKVIATDSKGVTKTLVKAEFTVGDVKAEETKPAASDSKITITGATKPGALKLKQAFTVKGTVKSTYALKKIEVGVLSKSTGKWQTCAHKVVNTTAKTYDINKVDEYMGFKKLTKGTYYYKIIATDSKGSTKTLVKAEFTVGDVKTEEPAASNITLAKATKPAKLKENQAFTVAGTVKSTYALNKIEIGVVDKDTGKWQSCAHKVVKTTAKSYDLGKVDEYMGFKKLDKGTYYYRIIATDSKGTVKTLLNAEFTVGNVATTTADPDASEFTLSGVTKPSELTVGQSFTVKGTIKSNLKMKKVEVGVVDKETGEWVEEAHKTVTVTSKTYDLAKVDEDMCFRLLPAGNYYYRIIVTDAKTTKRVVNKAFTVNKPKPTKPQVTVKANGLTLAYPASVISAIGKQPYSGPCSVYSMAYCRSIIDGKFPLGKYRSYLEKIIMTFSRGNWSGYAYWNEGGGNSTYYSTQLSCCQQILVQLHKGKPCIMRVISTRGNNHYVCVIGYVKGTTWDNVNSNSFIVLDPAYGTKRKMSETGYRPHPSPQIITFAK